MKRQFLILVLAGGLALMAAPNASATTPGFCGHNYAMLMQGAEANPNPATGSGDVAGPGGYPGWLTAIVGVGVIQFSSDCSSITGELIYNDGDVQFSETGIGIFAGPAQCYSAETIFSQGMPCFDGTNHFSAATVTTAGEPPGMALLQFTAEFNAYDIGAAPDSDATGTMPFAFTIHGTTGNSVLVGNTVPSTVTTAGAPGAPVLTLTLEEQSVAADLNPVPTTFGAAPYLGNSAIICSGTGADDDDLISDISNGDSGGVAGSYGNAVGSVQIFASGQAGGLLSFNGNDNLQVTGSTAPVSNNAACDFTEVPDPFDGPATFADGTSNLWSTISSPNPDATCSDSSESGGGFETSQVAWGTIDQNSYAMVTGLHETSFGFLPPGEMSTCTHIANTPAGTVHIAPASLTLTENGNTGVKAITVTNTSPVGCDITATLGTVSGPGTLTLTNATSTETTTVEGGAPELNSAGTLGVSCTQPATSARSPDPQTATATVTVTSVACQLIGTTSIPVTCKN